MRWFVSTALWCSALACAPGHVVNGRPYELRVPKGAGATPLPLVVLLHGYSATGLTQDLIFPFSKEVEARQFLYALPDGTRDAVGKRFWNATDACCNFQQTPIDDVAFLRAVIEDIKKNHAVDPKQVFVIGHSNGGFMALRLACEASDLVTGVVSVAGAAKTPFPACDGPSIPVLQLHGTDDDTIRYDGGSTGAAGGPYPGAQVTAQDYAERNGCTPGPREGAPLDLVGDDAAETTRTLWDGCRAPVELWTVPGQGHVPAFKAAWPGQVLEWLSERAR